jgi:hypothetical protein
MSEERNYEEEAAKMGHVPQEDWKGDPDKWRPAKEFVLRGENIIPIMRDKVSKLEKDLDMAVKLTKAELEQVRKESYDRAKQEYESKLAALDRKEAEAVEVGDTEAYKEVKKERQSIKPPAEPKPVNQEPPHFTEWKEKNPWYQEDQDLADYADFISHKIVHETPGITPAKLAEEMTARTKKQFPHKFTNPNRDKPGDVEGGSRAGGKKTTEKTFNDLPADAKGAYDRLASKFKVQGRELKKETYAKEYWAQGE